MREDPFLSWLQGSGTEASQVECRAWLLPWLHWALEMARDIPRTQEKPRHAACFSSGFFPLRSDVQSLPLRPLSWESGMWG